MHPPANWWARAVLLEYHVARHWADIEATYSYEGTDAIQSLLLGREIIGIGAFT